MSAATGVGGDQDGATGARILLVCYDDASVCMHYELWAFVGWPSDYR